MTDTPTGGTITAFKTKEQILDEKERAEAKKVMYNFFEELDLDDVDGVLFIRKYSNGDWSTTPLGSLELLPALGYLDIVKDELKAPLGFEMTGVYDDE